MIADINVFDPATIAPRLPTVVHDVPGGGMRFEQKATGLLATVVGGELLFQRGAHTGALPGQLLRRGRAMAGR
jgi:N-acyl-D-aspartate/D-glutamate deacylase